MIERKNIRGHRRQPRRKIRDVPLPLAIGLVLVAGAIFIALGWPYRNEIAELRTGDTRSQAVNGIAGANSPLPVAGGKYVCATIVAAQNPDMRALLVEFGIRGRSSQGLAVKIVTAGKLAFASHWDGPSLRTELQTKVGGSSWQGISENRSDYSYQLQFNWPPISPDASEYVYLEAEEQPVISDIFFLDNIYELRDEARAAKTAYDYAACPR